MATPFDTFGEAPGTAQWTPRTGARAVRSAAGLMLVAAAGFVGASVSQSLRPTQMPPPVPREARRAAVDGEPDAPLAQPHFLDASRDRPLGRSGPQGHGGSRHLKLPWPSPMMSGAPAALVRRGAALAAHSGCGKALPLFRRASVLDSSSAEAWYGVGLCSYELFRDAEAVKAVNRAVLANPTYAMGNLLAGFLDQQAGKVDAARTYYQRYLLEEPAGRYADEVRSVLDQLPEGGR